MRQHYKSACPRDVFAKVAYGKMRTDVLAGARQHIGQPKPAERAANCANRVSTITVDKDGVARETISESFRCRDVLCALCAPILAAQNAYEALRVCTALYDREPDTRFWLCTTTSGTVDETEIKESIDRANQAWRELLRLARYRRAITGGAISALEVTYSRQRDKPLNPHQHRIVAGDYIDVDALRADWTRKLGADSTRQVHMAAISTGNPLALRAALREVAKYCFKPGDIYTRNPDGTWHADVEAVRQLSIALKNRRKVGYTGRLRKIKAELAARDPEDFEPQHIGEIPLADWPIVYAESRYWDAYTQSYRQRGV